MSPLERLAATAARLVQAAEVEHGQRATRMKEAAAEIRCAAAEIRNALETRGGKKRHPKFNLVVGDERWAP